MSTTPSQQIAEIEARYGEAPTFNGQVVIEDAYTVGGQWIAQVKSDIDTLLTLCKQTAPKWIDLEKQYPEEEDKMTDQTKTKTVRDFQEFFKDKNPDLPVYLWRGEMVPSYSIDGIDHTEADPTGAGNDDSIPMPEAILLTYDCTRWAGKGVPEYEAKEIPL